MTIDSFAEKNSGSIGQFLKSNHKQTEIGILEDYTVVGLGRLASLVPRNAPQAYIRGVMAAGISTQLGISLSAALKRYVSDASGNQIPETYRHYQDIYLAGKRHVDATFGRFRPGKDPSAGVLYAKVALTRLDATYFAAGLLFRTGHLFEARVLLRMFLEQVAWAYRAYSLKDAQAAARISPAKAISALKKVLPKAGPLYGELSKEVHIGLETHLRFIDFTSRVSQVLITLGKKSWVSGAVLLDLADFWSVIYERTQWEYIASPENWEIYHDEWRLKPDRPFVSIAQDLRRRIMASASNKPA